MTWNDEDATLFGGRYASHALIGSGGAGDVHEVVDTRLGVSRALKLLYEGPVQSPSLRKRFFAEARVLARLHHPNIVPVYDVGTHGSRLFFVMELAKGGTIQDWLQQLDEPVRPQAVAETTLQILAALEYAHGFGIVHRDVKPANILKVEDGLFKLADFGVARYDDHSRDDLTQTGDYLGTLGYMAPEQRADPRDATPASDIYGMGATLYTMATMALRPPPELYAMALDPETVYGVPAGLLDVIRVATRARPADRYGSAQEMRDALQWALLGFTQ